MANIVYVRQPYPKGDGDAILRTKNLIGDEPFLVLFWDDIIDNQDWATAAQQLVKAHQDTQSSVICSYTVADSKVSNYGILETSDSSSQTFQVERFLEKPKVQETQSRNAIVGKYILTPDIFEYLEESSPIWWDGETRLADAFELMRKDKNIHGVRIEGEWYDNGSHIGYLKACINYAMKRDYLRDDILEFIKTFQ